MSKVLVVDDSSLARKLLRRILEAANHEIVGEAESGEQAVLEYKKLKPDFITMDMDMPGIGGLEASKTIITDHPEAKIIIISAHEQNDLKEELKRYGLKYFVIKPVTENNVLEAINTMMGDKPPAQENAAPSDANPEIVQSNDSIPGIKANDAVIISHYSGVHAFKGIVTGFVNNDILMKITKEASLYNIFEDDPIVIGYEIGNECFITEGEIVQLDSDNNYFRVRVLNTFGLFEDKVFGSFPTSLYIDLKIEDGFKKKYTATIKNIQPFNVIIKSKDDMDVGDKISFNLYLENKVFTLNADIESKQTGTNNFEYLLKLNFNDYSVKKMLTSYLQILKKDYERAIRAVKEV